MEDWYLNIFCKGLDDRQLQLQKCMRCARENIPSSPVQTILPKHDTVALLMFLWLPLDELNCSMTVSTQSNKLIE